MSTMSHSRSNSAAVRLALAALVAAVLLITLAGALSGSTRSYEDDELTNPAS